MRQSKDDNVTSSVNCEITASDGQAGMGLILVAS